MDRMFKEWLVQASVLFQNQAALSIFNISTLIIIIGIAYYYIKNKGLPPGPVGLPIVGYWPFLKESACHLQLHEMQKKYGDVFSFNYAGALYINLGSVKAIRDFHLAKSDCFERTADFSLLSFFLKDGIAFVNGELWKVQRKFALQQFKELGMTTMKDSMSGPIYDTIQELMSDLRAKNGEPVEIMQIVTDKCNAILRRTMFGDSGITEEEVRAINQAYAEIMMFMSVKNTLHSGTLAKYLLMPLQPGFREAKKNAKKIEQILCDIIDRHKLSFDEEHPKDLIDGYFKERNDRRSRGDPTAEYFTDKALVGNLHQFVGDGVLAIAGFVALFLKYVVENEEEQQKIYDELQEIVGPNRAPTIDDKSKLPYTNALILEILRCSDFFPLFPSQQCIKETTIRGYRIPKGAFTLMNTWGCHLNPDVYEEPEKFNPSRFIPEEGKSRPELPCTFGIGKRNCLGEGYTMTQVFLFLTTLIKNFKLSVPKDSAMTTFELLMSGKMEIVAHPRN